MSSLNSSEEINSNCIFNMHIDYCMFCLTHVVVKNTISVLDQCEKHVHIHLWQISSCLLLNY